MYNRSVNKLRYQSVAVNALKRLKNQSAVAAKGLISGNLKLDEMCKLCDTRYYLVICNHLYFSGPGGSEVSSQRFKGNIPLNQKNFKGNGEVNWFPLNAFVISFKYIDSF